MTVTVLQALHNIYMMFALNRHTSTAIFDKYSLIVTATETPPTLVTMHVPTATTPFTESCYMFNISLQCYLIVNMYQLLLQMDNNSYSHLPPLNILLKQGCECVI